MPKILELSMVFSPAPNALSLDFLPFLCNNYNGAGQELPSPERGRNGTEIEH
jgi:hypothetical protein